MFQVLSDWPSAPGWFDQIHERSGVVQSLLSKPLRPRLSLYLQVDLNRLSGFPSCLLRFELAKIHFESGLHGVAWNGFYRGP